MKSKTKAGASSLARALFAIVLTCGSHSILRAECPSYYRYLWSGGQPGFTGVLFLDSAYCRYDSSSGLCDLIGPGSYITTPCGRRYDLWQLQRDKQLEVRAAFSSTQLRQLYLSQRSARKGVSEGFTSTQNYTKGTLLSAMIVEHGSHLGFSPPTRHQDTSGSWIASQPFGVVADAGIVTPRSNGGR
jgi:hypothetical protein